MQTETSSRLVQRLEELGVDALVLGPTDSFRYALGFAPFPDERLCVLFMSPSRVALVVPSINAQDVRREAGDLPMMEWRDGETPDGALQQAISHMGVGAGSTIAVDPEMRADVVLAVQRALPGAAFIDGAAALRSLREVKSEGELDRLLTSARAADVAMGRAFTACAPGATEADIAAAAVEGFQSAGVDSISFAIVASGPNGAFPHHHTGNRKLGTGDAVVIDLGAKLAHYSSDLTRMAYLGEPSARYREVHTIVERACAVAIETVKPGVTCGEIDSAARMTIGEAGFGDYFVHRTGHGLGLSMHEPPWIVPGSDEIVAEGMVFSIEPGIYLPGEFGIRLEDIVRVTMTGCEVLSGMSRELHVA